MLWLKIDLVKHIFLSLNDWVNSQETKHYINININICSVELKLDGKKLEYEIITRWGEYE